MIQVQSIDGLLLREMVLAGAALLEKNREAVDALNVFPVPDGDTGTNMSLTMTSATRELNSKEFTTAGEAAEALSKGALRGARGNSGVITSQLYRGFAKALKGVEKITPVEFAAALQKGAETAYKAVMKPKEGTILTVARTIAEDAVRQAQLAPNDFDALFNVILQSGDAILKRTPEMLPVLKQAGVVDAGGYGLLLIYTGYAAVLRGESIESIATQEDNAKASEFVDDHDALEEIKFAYHVALHLIRVPDTVPESEIDHFRRRLNRIGDTVLLEKDENGYKAHVHTADPGRVLQYGAELGELDGIEIVNLLQLRRAKEEAEAAAHASEPPKPYGMVSVSLGEGFSSILKDLQVDAIVEGGQTMNPSIEDLQKAIDSVNAETIFVFPNNGNVILAATQAAQISDKNVIVIPTKNVAMGIAAAVAFQPDLPAEENAARMEEAAQRVRTGTITYAVRDSEFEDMHINEGDIIGLHNGKVAYKADNVHDVAIELVKAIVTEDDGLITIYYGQDTKEEEAQALAEEIGELCPDCDVEVHAGGQPLYYYLIAVE
ncbi:MAG: DAK2 domain-containing protein [Clostridia bacterium]|nr:DAK2 domain-containing protein [Clostridia bacterium]MBR0227565.1 DAK2 domain-containing protein [Clostridia bacterium]